MSARDGNQKQFKEERKQSVKLLTFNTWGLKFISKFRKQRLRAIADALANPATEDDDYDIVALQEIWCEEDWQYLDLVCSVRYPYRRIFKSGIISGPGLAVLSKIPVAETFLYRFPINGRPSAFFRGDFYVGKSIAVTMFKPQHPDILPIALLNSHMHAPYGLGDASYSTHRACQAWDFAKLVRMLKRAGYAVIQVGDLNSTPDSLPYKLFTIEGGLSDSWNILNKDRVIPNEEIAKLSLEDQVLLAGVTCNSRLNTWRSTRPLWEACRLDYALIDAANITPIDAKVKFVDKLLPPFRCSYSDHFAYSVDLVVNSMTDRNIQSSGATNEEKEAVYRELLAEISQYRKYTIPRQLLWRKAHFLLSCATVVGMHVGIAFVVDVAAWVSVVFLLMTSLVIITGGLNGLIWYMGVRSELRALQEVQMEVEDAYNFLVKQNS
ncbi:Inositol phosphosphingolipids phospholipase C [Candida viswanathii]|uniref:Inositol phosphosphingolipids phospholipase C n=1 Tax=Candida viswanathii TaxID=5486 RepID=A0A367Y1E3_9ASCO|nr:Inositol phosphosphingolipids phospholipase C [Candida viswanathii]